MNINFREETRQRLLFMANKKGQSLAAFVSELCDNFVCENVLVRYSLKKEEEDLGLDQPLQQL